VESREEMRQRHFREREELDSQERAETRKRMQEEREAKARDEAETRIREYEAKIASEVAAASVSTVLNALAARAVTVTANSSGGVDCRPSGSLSVVERRVLTEKKAEVLRLLVERDAVETL